MHTPYTRGVAQARKTALSAGSVAHDRERTRRSRRQTRRKVETRAFRTRVKNRGTDEQRSGGRNDETRVQLAEP